MILHGLYGVRRILILRCNLYMDKALTGLLSYFLLTIGRGLLFHTATLCLRPLLFLLPGNVNGSSGRLQIYRHTLRNFLTRMDPILPGNERRFLASPILGLFDFQGFKTRRRSVCVKFTSGLNELRCGHAMLVLGKDIWGKRPLAINASNLYDFYVPWEANRVVDLRRRFPFFLLGNAGLPRLQVVRRLILVVRIYRCL